MPKVEIARLMAGTRFLIETEGGVWSLKLKNPKRLEVEVVGTDPRFASKPAPVLGVFVESCDPATKHGSPGEIIKGQSFSVRFRDVVLVSQPITSVLIEGPGWSYEL